MKKILFGALSLAVAASLNAKVFATVDGVEIKNVDLAPMLAGLQGMDPAMLSDEHKKQIIDRAIDIKLLTKNAVASGVKNDELFKEQLAIAEENIALRVWELREIEKLEIKDEEVNKFYEDNKAKFVEPAGILASHILVEKEEDAKKIIADLSKLKGEELEKKFAEIASEKSIDPSGKENGGNLGWFQKEQMVEPFGTSADALKKGEMTKAPVKSQFGYHIILKHDAKEAKQLNVDEVKPYITGIIRQDKAVEMINKKVEELRSKAKIEYK
ncbi:MAG: peptidylprolyl isomerase [Campylobacteraceae bacterium]|nr:peptidylprolyl isomerase [Campylobacteraceae bacterium]